MRQKILLFSLALAVAFHAISQIVVDTLILDNSKMGFGLLILKTPEAYKNELYNKFVTVSTGPTLISCTKNGKGDISAKMYLNTGLVNIVSTGINASNNDEYQLISTDAILPGKVQSSETSWSGTLVEEVFQGKKMAMLGGGGTDSRITKYMIREKKTGKSVASMIVEYVYPRPAPLFMSIDSIIIDNADARPSGKVVLDSVKMIVAKKMIADVNLTETQYDSNGFFGLPKKLVLPTENNSLVIYFRKAGLYFESPLSFLEYKLHDHDTIWRTTPKSDFPCILLKNLKTGKYQLNVRHPNQAAETFRYEFEIRPRFTETTTFKVLAGSAVTALVCGGIFYVKNREQQKKINAETFKRKLLSAELSSLRSQLNPHFIFNALSSIQGLFNSQQASKANQYLADFSTLLRETLINKDKEFVPLSKEIATLTTYIKLEQLRFNFQYHITVEENIIDGNFEMPFLLAQPLVENAIKHGLSSLGEKGILELNVFAKQNEFCLQVKDNGKGFNSSLESITGIGLQLTKDRIKLLNEADSGIQIAMNIESQILQGTTVTLTYKTV